jgi:hypothetical protein
MELQVTALQVADLCQPFLIPLAFVRVALLRFTSDDLKLTTFSNCKLMNQFECGPHRPLNAVQSASSPPVTPTKSTLQLKLLRSMSDKNTPEFANRLGF